jgi:hypothetical protein
MLKSSPPLFCNTNPLPDRLLTVPPTVYLGAGEGPLPGVQAIINNIKKKIIPIGIDLFLPQTELFIVASIKYFNLNSAEYKKGVSECQGNLDTKYMVNCYFSSGLNNVYYRL